MEEQQRAAQLADFLEQVGRLHPLDEFTAEREIAATDRDRPFPLLADGVDIAFDPGQHMRHIAGRADGSDRGDLVESQIVCRSEHRRPAEAVPDQQDGLRKPVQQVLGRSDQVGDIGGETGTAEVAFTAAQPGEVEPQTGNAFTRQRARHADRRAALLGAGEAMREQRRPAHQPGRHFQRAGQLVPRIGGDRDRFGRHAISLASEPITPPCTSGARPLTLT